MLHPVLVIRPERKICKSLNQPYERRALMTATGGAHAHVYCQS